LATFFLELTFCFFSLGQSKLPGYILPILPIIAVISGGQIISRGQVKADRWVMLSFALLFLIGAFNVGRLANGHFVVEQWESYTPWLIGSGILFLLAFAALSFKKLASLPAFAGAAVASMAAALLVVSGATSLAESRSSRVGATSARTPSRTDFDAASSAT